MDLRSATAAASSSARAWAGTSGGEGRARPQRKKEPGAREVGQQQPTGAELPEVAEHIVTGQPYNSSSMCTRPILQIDQHVESIELVLNPSVGTSQTTRPLRGSSPKPQLLPVAAARSRSPPPPDPTPAPCVGPVAFDAAGAQHQSPVDARARRGVECSKLSVASPLDESLQAKKEKRESVWMD